MIDLTKITDPYDRKARIYPALLCLLPVVVAVSISYPEIYKTLAGFATLIVAFGGLQLLANLARSRGKRLENDIYKKWGGIPSVCIFRHCDTTVPKPAKQRYHGILSEQSGIDAPSENLEKKEPAVADETYRSWSDFLRARTRDTKKYSLLFKKNINFGFRRNLLGIKWYCVLSGMIGILIIFFPEIFTTGLNQIDISIITLILVYISIFLFVVSSDWVKIVADEYAKRLIESVDS